MGLINVFHCASSCQKKTFMRPLCPQLRQCHRCHALGHLARDCPKKSATKDAPAVDKGKGKGKGSEKSRVEKEDDQASVQSNSTAATRTDIAAPAPQKCTFCGAPRATTKYKRGHNACKDRCQQ